MPELPEVETVARQLAFLVTGQLIEDISISDPRLGQLPELPFKGTIIRQVERIGKQIFLHLEIPAKDQHFAPFRCYLAVHLRMTGRLLWRPRNPSDTVRSIPDLNYVNETGNMKDSKYCRAVIHCTDGNLEFVDVRRFGTWKFSRNPEDFEPQGIDPLSSRFTRSTLAGMLSKSQQTMKQWLLRQDRLVGLGNIYACEILFRTGISPLRIANTLNSKSIDKLFDCIPDVLNQAIQHCGTTFSDFQHADGQAGGFQNFLMVYQKEGTPCKCCGQPIARIPQNGRSTFYCPSCQH